MAYRQTGVPGRDDGRLQQLEPEDGSLFSSQDSARRKCPGQLWQANQGMVLTNT
jgi:hypothetical protein